MTGTGTGKAIWAVSVTMTGISRALTRAAGAVRSTVEARVATASRISTGTRATGTRVMRVTRAGMADPWVATAAGLMTSSENSVHPMLAAGKWKAGAAAMAEAP